MDVMPNAKLAKTYYGFNPLPIEFNGKLTWGTLRQFGRWPLDRQEREIIRIRGQVPCQVENEWNDNFTIFVLSNLDKKALEPISDAFLIYTLEKLNYELEKISWYLAMDEPRRGVVLDIAYKNGLEIVADRDLYENAKAKQYSKIAAIIIQDAGRDHKSPSDFLPFGSRSYTLAGMMQNGKWPEWAKD